LFENYRGNNHVTAALERMIEQDRIAQTLLFAGPEGIGKATLARRFGARLLGGAEKIEQDDLSLPHNLAIVTGREKWVAEKRNEDPLLFSSHPDFVTFAPDGPLRQLSIPQMRQLKESAQFKPSRGARRIFLIDHNLSGVSAVGRGFTIFLIAIVGDDQTISTILLQTGSAVGALPTGIDEAANAGEIAHFELLHLIANLLDAAQDLVSRHHGVNGVAPFVANLMDIRVANATVHDLNLNIVRTGFSAI